MLRLAFGLLLLTGPVAFAQPVIYRAQSYTSGTDERDRPAALARCVRDVLVQVSGNPTLLKDPRVANLETKAETLVSDYVYLDRMTDVPHHDEQGSRDRPYDLVVQFDPARIDTALAELGEKPWPARDRPNVYVRIVLTQGTDTGLLTSDGVFNERQRRALLAAADKYGLHVVLPPGQGQANPLRPDEAVLGGTLEWKPEAFGWVGAWHLALQGRDHAWSVEGVSYDEAFRSALRGALEILSGHGEPS
jgi:hypothetical protein